MTRPLVSVCIPTYNRPQALAVVIEEILAQTYPSIEIVVTDDGDADPTRQALAPYMDRIRYSANEKRLGLYGNWNHSIALARGDLVAVYHDHDHYAPTIVERSVELFEESPRVGVVHVGTVLAYEEGGTTGTLYPDLPRIWDGRSFAERQAWRWESYLHHGCMMVRNELYDRLGTFDETLGIAADMEMLIRFCMECDIGYVADPLYRYVGRRKGDDLYEMRWNHTTEYAHVRKLNFERVYADRPAMKAIALAGLRYQTGKRVLAQLLGAKMRGQEKLVEEGLRVIAEICDPATYAAARAAVAPAVTPLRTAAYRVYKARQAARARAAAGAP